MARRNFLTVPEELLDTAEQAADYYSTLGYSIGVEKRDLGFPFTPALLCKRKNTTLIVEVDDRIRIERLHKWAAYAKSAGRDTRVILVLPTHAATDAKQEDGLREIGVGLIAANDAGCIERVAGRDLALGVELPSLAELPKKVRPLLGPAYEQFARSQWREGFEEACQAFEAGARRYLKAGIRSGRVVIQTKKGPLQPGAVDKFTMGQLADIFTKIQHQNRADAIIGQTLKAVNKDRVGVAHKKALKRTENRLRGNVGRHMWSLVEALTELVK
jgi:hypothetical protein